MGALLALGACEPPVAVDDWGTAGYAIVRGEVVRANGDAYAVRDFRDAVAEGRRIQGGSDGEVNRRLDSDPVRYSVAFELRK